MIWFIIFQESLSFFVGLVKSICYSPLIYPSFVHFRTCISLTIFPLLRLFLEKQITLKVGWITSMSQPFRVCGGWGGRVGGWFWVITLSPQSNLDWAATKVAFGQISALSLDLKVTLQKLQGKFKAIIHNTESIWVWSKSD